MEAAEIFPARLTLRAHEPTLAKLEAVPIPRRTRVTRAIEYLIGFWILAPIVTFIPPHIPWLLGAFFAGLYFFYKNWVGEYLVVNVDATCPHCGHELTIKPGAKIRFPYRMACPQCHFTPEMELLAPDDGSALVPEDAAQ